MLSIIVAKANNDVIGGDNKLLWHISEDLKRFKEITSGNTIIMGRKTFESLPKILPNSHHIIITRDKSFKVDSPMVEVVNDIE
ncbi:dihydrofolate reductase, partial [Clostridium perfringens]